MSSSSSEKKIKTHKLKYKRILTKQDILIPVMQKAEEPSGRKDFSLKRVQGITNYELAYDHLYQHLDDDEYKEEMMRCVQPGYESANYKERCDKETQTDEKLSEIEEAQIRNAMKNAFIDDSDGSEFKDVYNSDEDDYQSVDSKENRKEFVNLEDGNKMLRKTKFLIRSDSFTGGIFLIIFDHKGEFKAIPIGKGFVKEIEIEVKPRWGDEAEVTICDSEHILHPAPSVIPLYYGDFQQKKKLKVIPPYKFLKFYATEDSEMCSCDSESCINHICHKKKQPRSNKEKLKELTDKPSSSSSSPSENLMKPKRKEDSAGASGHEPVKEDSPTGSHYSGNRDKKRKKRKKRSEEDEEVDDQRKSQNFTDDSTFLNLHNNKHKDKTVKKEIAKEGYDVRKDEASESGQIIEAKDSDKSNRKVEKKDESEENDTQLPKHRHGSRSLNDEAIDHHKMKKLKKEKEKDFMEQKSDLEQKIIDLDKEENKKASVEEAGIDKIYPSYNKSSSPNIQPSQNIPKYDDKKRKVEENDHESKPSTSKAPYKQIVTEDFLETDTKKTDSTKLKNRDQNTSLLQTGSSGDVLKKSSVYDTLERVEEEMKPLKNKIAELQRQMWEIDSAYPLSSKQLKTSSTSKLLSESSGGCQAKRMGKCTTAKCDATQDPLTQASTSKAFPEAKVCKCVSGECHHHSTQDRQMRPNPPLTPWPTAVQLAQQMLGNNPRVKPASPLHSKTNVLWSEPEDVSGNESNPNIKRNKKTENSKKEK